MKDASDIILRPYTGEDLPQMLHVWNEVVDAGNAFPQIDTLDMPEGTDFFASQSYCGVACQGAEVVGLYILHPNNIGRCGHIANASYAVASKARGKGVGELMVRDSICQARRLGFGILQFNAVVLSNHAAHKLYEKLGFKPLGIVPGGFRRKDGAFEDIKLYYYKLSG